MSLPRRLILGLALGLLSLFVVSFALPLAAIKAAGTSWDIGAWAIDLGGSPGATWWAATGDDKGPWPVARAGVYDRWEHPLIDRIDMRRVIFTGNLKDQSFFNQNTPPRWAATISVDFREGFDQVVSTATGWPFRAFRGEHWIRWRPPEPPAEPVLVIPGLAREPAAAPPTDVIKSQWIVADSGTGAWAIPYGPIWVGLLADWACFSAASMLILSFGALRRIFRARRGLCTRCAYDLKGLPQGSPCPECGAGTSAVLTGLTHKTAAITEPSPHDE